MSRTSTTTETPAIVLQEADGRLLLYVLSADGIDRVGSFDDPAHAWAAIDELDAPFEP